MRVAKWGNSLAVRLPNSLIKELELRPGDVLEIVRLSKGKLELDKADRRAAALERMAERRWTLPAGYKFDREEANEQ